MTIKYSRQRELIARYLKGRTDHPTADMIYASLKKSDPKISLATVYRNLALLEELGELGTLVTGDGKVHFDPNTAPHSHLVCRRCGTVHDISLVCPEEMRSLAETESGGNIDDAQLFFYGICGDCAEKA